MTKDIVYPFIDEKREQRISICEERLIYGEREYFFSPHFKRSDEVIDGVLRGYVSTKNGLMDFFSGRDFCVKQDFKKKKAVTKIGELINSIKEKNDGFEISMKDILAFYSGRRFTILLTSEKLISDYERDDTGETLICFIRDVDILENGIIRDNATNHDYEWGEFSDEFIRLFLELKELNKVIDIQPGKHPLNKEMREMREKYLNILVNKALFDGGLSSNEVVRIEIMARQLGIDSMSVLQMISNGLKLREKYGEDQRGYILESLKNLNGISNKYYYMLYHDVISLELLAKKGEITGDHQNEFSELLARQCSISDEFRQSYCDAMQKLVVSSYALRHTLIEKGSLIKNQEAYENLFNTVEYEYELQRELLR